MPLPASTSTSPSRYARGSRQTIRAHHGRAQHGHACERLIPRWRRSSKRSSRTTSPPEWRRLDFGFFFFGSRVAEDRAEQAGDARFSLAAVALAALEGRVDLAVRTGTPRDRKSVV